MRFLNQGVGCDFFQVLGVPEGNITVLSYSKLRDDPSVRWREEVVSEAVLAAVHSNEVRPISVPKHSEESFSKYLWFAFVIVLFWLKWAGYLAGAGLNLLAQIFDRISPFGV